MPKTYALFVLGLCLLGTATAQNKKSLYKVDIRLSRSETTSYATDDLVRKYQSEYQLNLHTDAAVGYNTDGSFRCEVVVDDEAYEKAGGKPFTGSARCKTTELEQGFISCESGRLLGRETSGQASLGQDGKPFSFTFDYYPRTDESTMSMDVGNLGENASIDGTRATRTRDCKTGWNTTNSDEFMKAMVEGAAASVFSHPYLSNPVYENVPTTVPDLPPPLTQEQTDVMEAQMKQVMTAEQFALYKHAQAQAQQMQQQAGQQQEPPSGGQDDSPPEQSMSGAEGQVRTGWGGRLNTSRGKNGDYTATYSFETTVTNSDGSISTYQTLMSMQIYRTKKAEVKALIMPITEKWEVYDKWIPEGEQLPVNENPNFEEVAARNYGRGNRLDFKVILVEADDMSKNVSYLHDYNVIFTLKDVSHHKGICNNYPLDNANKDPDLRFDTLDIQFDDGKYLKAKTFYVATAPRSGADASVGVIAYDYAAFGKLSAKVVVEDLGIDLTAEYEYKPGQPFLKIPRDDNENEIADAWEKDMEIFSQKLPASADTDLYPKDQKCDGDGYTLFEEFRGFVAKDHLLASQTNGNRRTKGEHFRSDPRHKDCFVIDDNGCFARYYDNDAWLNWHYLRSKGVKKLYRSRIDGDITSPENRWVNFNSDIYDDTRYFARQYAMLIMTSSTVGTDSNTVGGTEAGSKDGQSLDYKSKYFDSPMRANYRILLYPERAKLVQSRTTHYQQASPELKAFIVENDFRNTVNHEVGHHLGIPHHRFVENRGNKFYDSFNSGPVGEAQGGSNNCTMRYYTVTDLEAGILDTPYPTRYCRKGESGVKLNIFGRVEVSNYPGDDCFSFIKVKCDKDP